MKSSKFGEGIAGEMKVYPKKNRNNGRRGANHKGPEE